MTSSTTSHIAVPLHRRKSSTVETFWAQLNHHRDRRLALEDQRRQLQEGLPRDNHHHHQRQQQAQVYSHPSHWRRTLQSSTTNSESSVISLSNCHLILWTGPIQVGTPPQEFLVQFDNGSTDIWIPSKACNETCNSFPDWRKYDASASSTYEIASDDPDENAFYLKYQDGEWIEGQHAIDVIRLGGTTVVENQIFAQVTSVHSFSTCEAEEGVLGLALGPYSYLPSKYPSLLQNLMDTDQLRHSMYSLYLNSRDDYPDQSTAVASVNHYQDTNGNVEHGYSRPTSASSQIVFGGVDPRHYEGCLQWHDLGQFEDTATGGGSFQGFWDFSLESVNFGGRSVSTSNLALLDTGSSYVIGPSDAVAKIAAMNHASCFTMVDPANPQLVECTGDSGFDVAIIECDAPLFNLEFVADGRTYVLEKEDLIIKVNTSFGEACVLRLIGSEGIPGWVLGDVFLNKYYAVFDFENERVGLALAVEDTVDWCETDSYLVIPNITKSLATGTTASSNSPTAPSAPTTNSRTSAPSSASPATKPTIPSIQTAEEAAFDFSKILSPPSNQSTSIEASSSSSSSQPLTSYSDTNPPAILAGIGIAFFAMAFMLWRRRRVQQKRQIEAIIRHAEANSPYRDDLTGTNHFSTYPSSIDDSDHSHFVEIDLQTLHRMN